MVLACLEEEVGDLETQLSFSSEEELEGALSLWQSPSGVHGQQLQDQEGTKAGIP
jgi:hypothetical protein